MISPFLLCCFLLGNMRPREGTETLLRRALRNFQRIGKYETPRGDGNLKEQIAGALLDNWEI